LTKGYAKCGAKLQCQCKPYGRRNKAKASVAAITLKCPRKFCKCPKGLKFRWATQKCMNGKMPRFNRKMVKRVTKKALKKCMKTPACKAKVDALKSVAKAKRIAYRTKNIARNAKKMKKMRKYLKNLRTKAKKLKGFKKFWHNSKVFRTKQRLKYMRIIQKRKIAGLKKLKAGKMSKRMKKRDTRQAMWKHLNGAYMKKLSAELKAWRKTGVKKTCSCTDKQKKPKGVCPKRTYLRMRSCKCPGAPKPAKKIPTLLPTLSPTTA